MDQEEERLIAVEVKSIEVVTKREQDQPVKEIKTLDDLEEIVEENIIVPEVDEEETKDLSEKQTEETDSKKDSNDNDDELKDWFDLGKERFTEEEEKEIKDSYGYFRDESQESKEKNS